MLDFLEEVLVVLEEVLVVLEEVLGNWKRCLGTGRGLKLILLRQVISEVRSCCAELWRTEHQSQRACKVKSSSVLSTGA